MLKNSQKKSHCLPRKFDTHLDIEEAKREKGARAMDDKRRIQFHDQA